MSFFTLYRISFYVMLTLATLVMSVEATNDSRIAMFYPPAVAVACALAFLTVDRNPRYRPSKTSLAVLEVLAVVCVYVEYRITEHSLLSLSHWLVYHQLIKTFLPKTVEDDWLLFALALMQVLVGTVISQSGLVGTALIAWVLSALWVLGLFYLQRESQRKHVDPGVTVTPMPIAGSPYPGLFDLQFLFASLRVVAITLALGGAIFLIMPRSRAAGMNSRTGALPQHMTGFSDEVQLGQLGEILENDAVVMSIELFDGGRNRIIPGEGLHWRGVSMGQYENGRWRRSPFRGRELRGELRQRFAPKSLIVQRIKMEPSDGTVLFGLRPFIEVATEGRVSSLASTIDGSIHRSDVTSGSFDYTVWSYENSKLLQPYEDFPSDQRMGQMLQVPDPLKEHLRAIALPLVEKIPDTDIVARAEALESYLRDSNKFAYTLEMNVIDPAVDPVEDFLLNRKEGHCGYFASALALLLRSIDIPARMVNGFMGGDWNDVTGVLTVRQKHAHSWVEVLVGKSEVRGSYTNGPIWITLDPSPALGREETVERVGAGWSNARLLSDFARYVWMFYIAGYDAERQQRLIYGPVAQLLTQASRGYRAIVRLLTRAVRALLNFPSRASFFSVRGFLTTFFALLILAVLYWLLAWILRRVSRWWRGADTENSPLSAGVAFYRRLAQLLATYGLERPPAETPREFARRASGYLSGRGPETDPVADVPPQVVDAFYSIRFGHLELDPETLRRLESRIDALEALLRP